MGVIERFMTDDHERLRALLARAIEGDAPSYEALRQGLLRHVAMEEKALLPEAARRRAGEPLAIARLLRADHSAIAALFVPPPDRSLLERLRALLALHDPLEEGESGVYAQCDRLLGKDADALVERMRATPAVPVAKHFDGARARDHIEALLAAALRDRAGRSGRT